MPNKPVQAAAEGLPKITRRLFLGRSAIAGMVGATAMVPVAMAEVAPALTPDERIAAALGDLKTAYREKFPEVEIRVCINDDDAVEFVQVIAFCGRERSGKTTYLHNCNVVRREGGDA